MFKRYFSMLLALCLLLTTSSVALMEESIPAETLLEAETLSAPAEAPVGEESDQEIGEVTADPEAGDPETVSTAGDEGQTSEVGEDNDAVIGEDGASINNDAVEGDANAENAVEGADAPADDTSEEPAAESTASGDAAPAEIVCEEDTAQTDETAPVAESAPAAEEPAAVEQPAEPNNVVAEAAAEGAMSVLPLTANTSYTMSAGDFVQLYLGDQVATSYKSSKKKVATVSATGLITALNEGKTKITVKLATKKKLTLILKVVDPSKPTSVVISMDGATPLSGTITANQGVPMALVAVASSASGIANTNFKWTSSKKKVATISSSGNVVTLTPKKAGTTTITVKATRGGKKARIKVKVIDPFKANAVYLNQTGRYEMTQGETLQLSAIMDPIYSTSRLKWKSSNRKVATVTQNGLVRARKKGTATITVKTSSGKKARLKVKVLKKAGNAKGMVAEWSTLGADNTLELGEERVYVISMNPRNATANVLWAVGNPDVIQIKDFYRSGDFRYQCTIVSKDIGFTNLVALDTVSGAYQEVTIYVIPAVEPESISFPNLNNSPMKVGEKRDIEYLVEPTTSWKHNSNRAQVEYDHSILSIEYDPNNADRNCRGTMDYNLHITAVGKGTTTVKIFLRGKPSVSASFEITVQ